MELFGFGVVAGWLTPSADVFARVVRREEGCLVELKLSEDRLTLMTEKVQSYFRREHDESVGKLKAEMYIEFFLKELGPKIYNQAIDDASVFIHEKLIDLDSTLYIPE